MSDCDPKQWFAHYVASGQLDRDIAHKIRPQLPDCKFGWYSSREWCRVHDRYRIECEKLALESHNER